MTKKEYETELNRLTKLMLKYDDLRQFSAGDRVARAIDKLNTSYRENKQK